MQPLNESVTNTGHVPASINRKMTIRAILDEIKQNKKKGEKKTQQTKFPKMSSFLTWKKVKPHLHINKINMNKKEVPHKVRVFLYVCSNLPKF